LPAVRQTNGLEVTLKKIETGLDASSSSLLQPFWRMAPNARSMTRATFQVKEKGAPAPNWYVSAIRARNANGEAHLQIMPIREFPRAPRFPAIPPQPLRPGFPSVLTNRALPLPPVSPMMIDVTESTFSFVDTLWPEEPAWKLEVDVVRASGFPTDELWVIKGVQAPKDSELVEAPQTITRDGLNLEFIGVNGPGGEPPPAVAVGQPVPTAKVQVRLPRVMDDWQVALVEVQDETGRKARSGMGAFSTSGAGNRSGIPLSTNQVLRGFGFEIPERAEKLDIKLAVTRVQHVHFMAKPTVGTNDNKTIQ
jgi:hypothetical protein